jgi:hypothetical protein
VEEFSQYFDFSTSKLTTQEQSKLLQLLYEFEELFVKKGETLKATHLMEMDIKLKPEATPLKAKAYRTTPQTRQEINKQLNELLRGDIIETCDGEFTSPVFLVPKADSTFRMVVDYRKLNQQTIPENFPMQNITDTLQALGSKHPTIFTTLDMQSGYHQIKI